MPQLARRHQAVQRPHRPHRHRRGCFHNRQRYQLRQHIEVTLHRILVNSWIARALSFGRQNVDREHAPSVARKRAAGGIRRPRISDRVDAVVLSDLSHRARQPLAHRQRRRKRPQPATRVQIEGRNAVPFAHDQLPTHDQRFGCHRKLQSVVFVLTRHPILDRGAIRSIRRQRDSRPQRFQPRDTSRRCCVASEVASRRQPLARDAVRCLHSRFRAACDQLIGQLRRRAILPRDSNFRLRQLREQFSRTALVSRESLSHRGLHQEIRSHSLAMSRLGQQSLEEPRRRPRLSFVEPARRQPAPRVETRRRMKVSPHRLGREHRPPRLLRLLEQLPRRGSERLLVDRQSTGRQLTDPAQHFVSHFQPRSIDSQPDESVVASIQNALPRRQPFEGPAGIKPRPTVLQQAPQRGVVVEMKCRLRREVQHWRGVEIGRPRRRGGFLSVSIFRCNDQTHGQDRETSERHPPRPTCDAIHHRRLSQRKPVTCCEPLAHNAADHAANRDHATNSVQRLCRDFETLPMPNPVDRRPVTP